MPFSKVALNESNDSKSEWFHGIHNGCVMPSFVYVVARMYYAHENRTFFFRCFGKDNCCLILFINLLLKDYKFKLKFKR